MRAAKLGLVALTLAALVAGCGRGGQLPVGAALAPNAAAEALATRSLLTGYKHLFMAVFTKLDANTDKFLDEYEASQHIDLRDFQKADRNKNGRLTRKEFMDYAAGGKLFGFMKQDKSSFMKAARAAMLKAFNSYDTNKDRLLDMKELSEKAMTKNPVFLTIDALHVKVKILEVMDPAFEAADKTTDSKLSIAEFEDFCMNSFVKLINPNYSMSPTPPAAPPNEDPAAPDAPAAGGEEYGED